MESSASSACQTDQASAVDDIPLAAPGQNPEKDPENGDGSKNAKAISFFHPTLKDTRIRAYRLWAVTVLALGVFIIAVLSLYWGVLYAVYDRLPNITVWIVDFDAKTAPYDTITPIIGPFITKEFSQLKPALVDNLGWTIKPANEFDNDPMRVRQGVYYEKAHAAIIINSNATALLKAAVNQGNSSYDPTGAAQVIYNTARDQTTLTTYILPALLDTLFPILSHFGAQWASMLDRNSSTQNVFRTPQAVNPAIGFSFIDLRPFNPPTATPSISIGLIYLIIISFFSFSFLMPIHGLFIQPRGHPPVRTWHLFTWRIFSSIMAYFFLALCYSLISLAFQIPFSNNPAPTNVGAMNPNAYGKGSFVVYWMLNFVGMGALGLPCENMAMILGQPYSSLWLILWVITNVATSFYTLDLASDFYHWGRAWPLNRIVNGSRTILFDTRSTIGIDFGVLFAWVAVSIIIFPFADYIMKWRLSRQVKQDKK
ncbi:hypothetical protein BGW36DRAFT_65953 [Talaromyces proteolyticus]|uniref:DUF3533 domain-containing protein n=1 Tax=Talaromyces proteolyticus TaxID=1131652 RepID=A0AAD4KJX7_9EURO|nr:uncharacterized protein BGW36DRAFT_65953 [Talaromyces proteolyticus]KAH8689989.1 hypothetical protein BGW36DRAFT_65953 [Talaromyces proteolyticus]